MSGYRARIFDGPAMFDQNRARLVITDGRGGFISAPDLYIKTVAEGEMVPDDVGIVLPVPAMEAIYEAIRDWRGDRSAETEARVLREWLAVERQRVDKALDR